MPDPWTEKLAIQELCFRHCHTIDAQDSDGWAQCFVPDGAFEFDGHVCAPPALREYAEVHARVVRGRHMTLNHLYEISGDRATGRAATVVSIVTKSGFKIMGRGAYEDELFKADGAWKIRHRRVVNDYVVADPAMTVSLADPNVAALVQNLIDTANNLARRTVTVPKAG